MKILWLCNIMPPAVAAKLNKETSVKEGWIAGILGQVLSDENNGIELGICAPDSKLSQPYDNRKVTIANREIDCFVFRENTNCPWEYSDELEDIFKGIVEQFKPDVIHCFGTEYPHTLAMARAVDNPQKILLGIQGVMQACAQSYCGQLPENVVKGSTFRDWLKKDNIAAQQLKFAARAVFEKEAFSLAGHCSGRTDFDKKAAYDMNDKIRYHYMNETLRPEFYEGTWSVSVQKCHRIFVSQADYPLKGFHTVLAAMPEILDNYPDTKLYVAGNNITQYSTLKSKIKIGTYGKYLRTLVNKYGLEDHVVWLGRLSADQMKEQYLSASVYVCASYCENSPNSMGEAMLLGTPVVAARVGGIPSMAKEDAEAMMYNPDKYDELAANIIELFEKEELANNLSKNGTRRAKITHDKDVNFARLLEIYKDICQ